MCIRDSANTIQQKDFDGRIPQPLKEWAKSIDVCPENASRFLVDVYKRQAGISSCSMLTSTGASVIASSYLSEDDAMLGAAAQYCHCLLYTSLSKYDFVP